jgi:hypothetical protein
MATSRKYSSVQSPPSPPHPVYRISMISELVQSMPEASGIPRHHRFAADQKGKVLNLPKLRLTCGLKAQGRFVQKVLEILTKRPTLAFVTFCLRCYTLCYHIPAVTYLASNNKRKIRNALIAKTRSTSADFPDSPLRCFASFVLLWRLPRHSCGREERGWRNVAFRFWGLAGFECFRTTAFTRLLPSTSCL